MRPRARALVAAVVAGAALLLGDGARAEEATLRLDLGAEVSIELVKVGPGTFRMGSPPGEAGRGDDEADHEVTLTQGFYVGRFPVTRGQFARFAQETGYRTEAEKGTSGGFGWDGSALVQRKEFTWRAPGFAQADDHPVCLVTYDDAQAFCGWLATRARRAVQLPTEAQRELATRGGTAGRFYLGEADDDARSIAWFKANAGNGTRPVGQKTPNAFGLHDVSGNVAEWCRDWYAPYPPGPAVDPEALRPDPAQDKPRRVLRGGSWLKDARHCRSAARARAAPGSRNADFGFRVTAALEPTKVSQTPASPAPSAPAEPAGPPADRPPTSRPATAATTRSGGFALRELICCATAFGVPAVVFLAFRGKRNAPGAGVVSGDAAPASRRATANVASPRGSRATVRPDKDGFWVEGPDVVDGVEVRYRCRVRGGEVSGQIAATARQGGVFVYTGGQPSDVVILAIVPPRGSMSSPVDDHDAHDRSSWGSASHDHDRSHALDHDRDHDRGHGSAASSFPAAY